MILIDYEHPERNVYEVTEEWSYHNGHYGTQEAVSGAPIPLRPDHEGSMGKWFATVHGLSMGIGDRISPLLGYGACGAEEVDELQEDSVIRNFRITAADGKTYGNQLSHAAHRQRECAVSGKSPCLGC